MKLATRMFWATAAMGLMLVLPAAAMALDGASVAGGVTGGTWWQGLLQGIWGGILASFAGYAKNRDTRSGSHQEFGIQYLVQTCIFGAILGLVAGIFKINPSDFGTSAVASPIFAGLTMIFEVAVKAVWRNAVVKTRELMEDFKAGSANPTPPAPPTP